MFFSAFVNSTKRTLFKECAWLFLVEFKILKKLGQNLEQSNNGLKVERRGHPHMNMEDGKKYVLSMECFPDSPIFARFCSMTSNLSNLNMLQQT